MPVQILLTEDQKKLTQAAAKVGKVAASFEGDTLSVDNKNFLPLVKACNDHYNALYLANEKHPSNSAGTAMFAMEAVIRRLENIRVHFEENQPEILAEEIQKPE